MVQRREPMKLDALATAAGVSPRTVRYYVQRGLLPAPEFRGPDTGYGPEHLARLLAIRVLQARHLPLDEIQRALNARTLDEIERIAKGEVPAALITTAVVSHPDDDVPAPAPTASAARITRWRLAPGLELHLDDDATPAVKALAETLRRQAAQKKGHER